ncbi:MAG: LysM peptidoglycan-binding domain-containing protein [Caldilineaceae bacterium]
MNAINLHVVLCHRLSIRIFLPLVVASLLWITPVFAQDEPYVVQPGDTLSEIAKAHGTDVDTLRRLNGLGNVDFVWVGQRLLLPAVDEEVLAAEVADEIADDAAAASVDGAADAEVEEKVTGEDLAVVEVDTETTTSEAAPMDEEASLSSLESTTSGNTAPGNTVPESNTLETAETVVAELADELPTTVVAQNERTDIYIVKPGDTLSKIAVLYRTTLAHLMELIRFPCAAAAAWARLVAPVAGTAVATVRTVEPLFHTVAPGEALSMIARQYDVSITALASANGIANTGLIVPGQQLVIPNSAQPVGLDSIRMGSDGYHVHTEFPTSTEKWIDVDLSEQRLVAYRGHKPVRAVIISSGFPGTPTVTGTFRIWAKTPLQDMYAGNRAVGYEYYVKDVPWVQYFYKDYGFHGAYWHNNFGHPMSHGCVHLPDEDAKWLFEWASPTMSPTSPRDGWLISDDEHPGTLVIVHD